MSIKRILVLGSGFAGLWSAVGAARKLEELGYDPEAVQLALVNRDGFHNIRVRNYEADLTPVRVPLDDVLVPVGVQRVEGEVTGIDLAGQTAAVTTASGQLTLSYDRLVFALGSQLLRPNVAGLAEYAFDVDTYNGGARLNTHLQSLPRRPESPGLFTVVVVGAGLTGIEAATEMPEKLRAILAWANLNRPFHVILADHNPHVGSDMGESARPVIEEALAALGIEMRLGIDVVSLSPAGMTLRSGEEIPAATVVWCAGMRANPLTQLFPVERDRLGRMPVDEFMRVSGMANVFAAGDVAWAMMDDRHVSVMSCQHGRPMGSWPRARPWRAWSRCRPPAVLLRRGRHTAIETAAQPRAPPAQAFGRCRRDATLGSLLQVYVVGSRSPAYQLILFQDLQNPILGHADTGPHAYFPGNILVEENDWLA
jgi:NADH dehydrogenase